RQIETGLGHGEPARKVRVDVVSREADPGPPTKDRHEETEAVGIDSTGLACRRAIAGSRHQPLDLDEKWPAPFHRRGDHAPGRRLGMVRKERASRVGDLTKTVSCHLEDADLISRA